MSAQHTPGPWHTAGDQGVQIRSQRDQIAKVWTMRGNEWKANARLIAAAPDLLEKAQAAMAACERMTEQYGDVACGVDFLTLGNALRAAIAKATNPD